MSIEIETGDIILEEFILAHDFFFHIFLFILRYCVSYIYAYILHQFSLECLSTLRSYEAIVFFKSYFEREKRLDSN